MMNMLLKQQGAVALCRGLAVVLAAICLSVATASAGGRAVPPALRQEMVERVTEAMARVDGLNTMSQEALCRHYGFSYAGGECQDAKGSVPVDKLVDVAACHYPDLGEYLLSRRDEAARLEKQCGKKAGKLKSRLAVYDHNENKLQELGDATEARQKRQRSALDKAAKEIAAIERTLRKVEELDGKINQAVARIGNEAARTDVTLVRGKSGCRLSANVSKTVSPDKMIKDQRYVWEKEAEQEDEGIDL